MSGPAAKVFEVLDSGARIVDLGLLNWLSAEELQAMQQRDKDKAKEA